MSSKRSSYAAGHKRKYLVVIDDTSECDRAVYWAAKRAARTKSAVLMLRVIEPGDRNQQWLGVADLMQAEAHEEAKKALRKFAARAKAVAKVSAEQVIREGATAEQVLKLIEEDGDIAILVLGAGTSSEGPGPLVAGLAKTAGTFPIPVAIVPGQLADEDLDMIA